MSNRLIPDSSIRASSQRDQNHAAHHGRLGGNSYWCSKIESSGHMEIGLPKKYKITAVRIELQDSSNIRWILLYSHLLRKWIHYHTEYGINAFYLFKIKLVKLQWKMRDIWLMGGNWKAYKHDCGPNGSCLCQFK